MNGDAGANVSADAPQDDSRGVKAPGSTDGGSAQSGPDKAHGSVRKREPSIKNVTLGQIVEGGEVLRKFWMLIVALAVAVYGAFSYFATTVAVKQLACEADKRLINEDNKATVLIRTSEKAGFSNQRTTLLRLQNLLFKLQAGNQKVLKLMPLEEAIEKLIDEAKQDEANKDAELRLANKDLEDSAKAVTACKGDSK
jgi:hypothetical protein